MKVTVKLINAYSQGKRSGAPNFALSNLRASIKDPNSIQKIELGLIDLFFALLVIFCFVSCLEFPIFISYFSF